MAPHPDPEKDLKSLDPVGIDTNNAAPHSDPIATPEQASSSGDSIYDIDGDEKPHVSEKATRPTLKRLQSSATGVSEVSTVPPPPKRTTWERINPLKRNPEPVPKVRGPSPEYPAGFFSMLSFHWVTPLMKVCVFFSKSELRFGHARLT
jgi:hypothetical protein